ncbi:MAG TPA: MBOAT family O-acyltransferase [Kaistiaceae bacterium]|nr:MBOAT family O-acyltransferase [Kaistiaceae bacterium]
MIFNQFEFLFLFLPAVVAGFIVLRRLRHEWLIAASCLFYGLSGYQHLLVLLFGTAWVWIVSRRERFAGNGRLLTLAIVPPLFFLFYYKYMGFVFGMFGGGAAGTTDFELFSNISLPAGISFFTFHLLAFAIDRYNGKIQPHPPFKDFLLFMSFFPHLVAGPILRYADVSAAIKNLPRFRIDGNVLAPAFGHIAAGLAAKILLADTLAKYIAQVTAEVGEVGFAGGMLVLGGYSFRIYFDFYGYSLVAIGLGLLFGFSFPKNFADPYKAPGIREFWRRWHMTLSFWIRDYLYLPLGGNAR